MTIIENYYQEVYEEYPKEFVTFLRHVFEDKEGSLGHCPSYNQLTDEELIEEVLGNDNWTGLIGPNHLCDFEAWIQTNEMPDTTEQESFVKSVEAILNRIRFPKPNDVNPIF